MNHFEVIQLAILGAVAVLIAVSPFWNYFFVRRLQSEQRYDDRKDIYYRGYGVLGHAPFESQLRDYLMIFIAQVEIRRAIRLTQAAREMLIIPVLETAQINSERGFNIRQAESSIEDLVSTIAEQTGAERERSQGAKSVVRAFATRFCNIPPFCDGKSPDGK